MDVVKFLHFVFFCNMLTVAGVDLIEGTVETVWLADPERSACTGKRIDHAAARRRCQLHTAFNQCLPQLSRMPGSPLFTVAGDTRNIKNIPRYSAARVGPLVAVLLTPRRYANGVRV